MPEYKTLLDQILAAAERSRLASEQLVRNAYIWAFGEHCNIRNEAELAAVRFKRKQTLSDKALRAVQSYLEHLFGWPKLPMPAKP